MSNKTKPDLIIFVKGGCVQSVASRFPELKVSLCDWDNAEDDDDARRECVKLDKLAVAMSWLNLV